jgi:hypothetical protein
MEKLPVSPRPSIFGTALQVSSIPPDHAGKFEIYLRHSLQDQSLINPPASPREFPRIGHYLRVRLSSSPTNRLAHCTDYLPHANACQRDVVSWTSSSHRNPLRNPGAGYACHAITPTASWQNAVGFSSGRRVASQEPRNQSAHARQQLSQLVGG